MMTACVLVRYCPTTVLPVLHRSICKCISPDVRWKCPLTSCFRVQRVHSIKKIPTQKDCVHPIKCYVHKLKNNSAHLSHDTKVWKLAYGMQNAICSKHRLFSTCAQVLQTRGTQVSESLSEVVDPFKLAEPDLLDLNRDVKKELWTLQPELLQISSYYFDGPVKSLHPVIVVLIARALNYHLSDSNRLLKTQHKIALFAEMLYVFCIIHDDVVDASDIRRGKSSANRLWGEKKAVSAGAYTLLQAIRILAQLENEDVVHLSAQALANIIEGEIMQASSIPDDRERFSYYLEMVFKKLATLTASTCKAAAVLAGADATLQEAAFQYGRNIGIAYQLMDDMLDFISSHAERGKPVAADLKLGLATAPVLFACEEFPELRCMIKRKFSDSGDAEKAYDAVLKSDGLNKTLNLARKHCDKALSHISVLRDSAEKRALAEIVKEVLGNPK